MISTLGFSRNGTLLSVLGCFEILMVGTEIHEKLEISLWVGPLISTCMNKRIMIFCTLAWQHTAVEAVWRGDAGGWCLDNTQLTTPAPARHCGSAAATLPTIRRFHKKMA